MPSRILREGILTSERVNQLDSPAEVFYRRLMSKVDDYGLYDARLSILRSSLYPLRVDRVREADCSRWIAACEKAGLLALYQHDGKSYLQMLDTEWQTRSEPKYPLPPWGKGKHSEWSANSCKQVKTSAHLDVFEDVDVKPPHPPAGGADGFAEFWKAYPAFGNRKAGKPQCEAKWKTKGCAAMKAKVLSALEKQKASDKWLEEGGRFIPAPLTWLNQDRWEATEEVESAWHETAGGVKGKGAELGIPYTTDDECKPFIAYRARVFMAAGFREKAAA